MTIDTTSLAWGDLVSRAFRERVFALCRRRQMVPDYLMACMAFESAETFSPSIRNAAGSGAVGLIQFMPATARALGTSVEALAAMSAEAQLDYVERYFRPYSGRLMSLSDTYMAILWPAAIGQPEDAPLWTRTSRPTTYRQNAGLDDDKNGAITKAEAAAKVRRMLERGLAPSRRWLAS
jgi:Transglycosylase SLT domain.